MAKLALCVKASDLPPLAFSDTQPCVMPIPEGFFNVPTQLIDRAVCEFDDSTLQLIPYIILRNSKGEIFSYYRGGAGQESRLHSKVSVGLGGHVDIAPPEGSGTLGVLLAEALRELQEEAGLIVNHALEFTNLIHDATDEVGRVHLGLLAQVTLSDNQILTLEKGVIEKGWFGTLDDLFLKDIFPRLEGWSQAVANHLLAERLGPFHHRAPTNEEKGAFLIALGRHMQSQGLMAGAVLDGNSNETMIDVMAHHGLDRKVAASMLSLDLDFLTEAIDVNF